MALRLKFGHRGSPAWDLHARLAVLTLPSSAQGLGQPQKGRSLHPVQIINQGRTSRCPTKPYLPRSHRCPDLPLPASQSSRALQSSRGSLLMPQPGPRWAHPGPPRPTVQSTLPPGRGPACRLPQPAGSHQSLLGPSEGRSLGLVLLFGAGQLARGHQALAHGCREGKSCRGGGTRRGPKCSRLQWLLPAQAAPSTLRGTHTPRKAMPRWACWVLDTLARYPCQAVREGPPHATATSSSVLGALARQEGEQRALQSFCPATHWPHACFSFHS